jgi:hypothetical protein
MSEDEYWVTEDKTYVDTYPEEYEKVEAAIIKLAEHGKITEQQAESYINMFTKKVLETNANKEGYVLHTLELIKQASNLDNKKGGKKSRKRKTTKKSKKSRKTTKKSKKSRKRKTLKKRKKSRK